MGSSKLPETVCVHHNARLQPFERRSMATLWTLFGRWIFAGQAEGQAAELDEVARLGQEKGETTNWVLASRVEQRERKRKRKQQVKVNGGLSSVAFRMLFAWAICDLRFAI